MNKTMKKNIIKFIKKTDWNLIDNDLLQLKITKTLGIVPYYQEHNIDNTFILYFNWVAQKWYVK